MSNVRKAIVFSFLESYFGLALNIVSFTLLARLLTPQQIGVYSVALAIISVMQVIRDFGLVNFLIQKKDLGKDHVASAWGMSLLLGGTLFAIVQLGAPLLGRFYNDDIITTIARIVAFNFVLLPLNSVSLALLKRDMKFQMVMRVNMAAAGVGTLATLLLAWLGWGALSLAIGSVVNSLTVAVCVAIVGSVQQLGRPGLSRAREIFAFGGPLTAANIITSISMDINDLAVGKILGFTEVAIISRGQGLMNLFHRDFMNAARNVAFPAFSQANRASESLDEKYIAAVTAVTAIAFPFYGFMSLFPLDVIRLMFGHQWDQAAYLVPYFCVAGAFAATYNLVQTVMLAGGNAGLVSTAEFIFQPFRAILLTLVVLYFKALLPFAIAFMLVNLIGAPYFYYFKQMRISTDFRHLARRLWANALLAFACLAPSALIAYVFRVDHAPLPLVLFLGCALLCMVIWIVAVVLTRHPLYWEAQAVLARRRQDRAALDAAKTA